MASTLISLILILQACDKDDDTEPNEFIAESSSFSDFETWSLDHTAEGYDPAIGSTHGGNDSTVTREVFFKDGQTPSSSEYPVGTIIVKKTTNTGETIEQYTAMVKRGGSFTPPTMDGSGSC
ncbi:MAG: hypothetical protein WD048_15340 [Chitinophagales bacterium]